MDTHIHTKDADVEGKVASDGATRSMSVDDELLEQLGHVSELCREFSVFFGITLPVSHGHLGGNIKCGYSCAH